MTRSRIYGLIGIGVAGVGAAILLTTGSFSGNAGLKQSVEAPSAPKLPDIDDGKRQRAAPNLTAQEKANATTVSLVLEKGDTLLSALADAGVPHGEAYAASDSLRGILDLRSIKVGQEIRLSLGTFGEASAERRLESLTLIPDIDRLVIVERAVDESFEAQSQQIEHDTRLIPVSGRVATSLYDAARTQGVPMPVLLQAYGVLGQAIDFQRDIHTGDRFVLGYEHFDDGDFGGKHPGKLVYVSVTVADRTLTYFRYTTSDGFTGYFDAGGNSVQTSLIKTPVDGGKLSSLFGKREHPIFGYTRMHKGLDFAAPLGTPVLAAGDGVVTAQARKGSFGKYVSIRHDNEFSTAYAHLSRYRGTIGPGRRVRQGDVIGYVGATGLATGPNLHYEVLRDGRQVNPMELDLPSRRVLTGIELTRFRQAAGRMQSELEIEAPENEVLDEPTYREAVLGNG